LTIDFVLPPTLSIGVSNRTILLQFIGEANQAYAIEHSGQPLSNSWLVLTNLPPESTAGPRFAHDTTEPAQQYYRVRLDDN
jgi:hypothetical protein